MGELSFASTPRNGENGSIPLRQIQFLKGWLKKTRNGFVPIEEENSVFSSSPISLAQHRGDPEGWNSSAKADNSDDSYKTEQSVISGINLCNVRSPRLLDWDDRMSVMDESSEVTMKNRRHRWSR